jgi:hypothetical protein
VDALVTDFLASLQPLEAADLVHVFVDARTKARYCEVHIPAKKLVALSTTDVPLDPEDQPEYRANREIVTSHYAFEKMQQDAKERRSFSNLVAEFTTEYDTDHPLKIIGGQHRFAAIKEALADGVDQYHGVKVYFGLDSEQRLDVQLISNTVIAVSADLYDRMQETVRGPELRDWCQKVGLLAQGQDFADKRARGGSFTVRNARTFIMNYYAGVNASSQDFTKTDTTPFIAKSGEEDGLWEGTSIRELQGAIAELGTVLRQTSGRTTGTRDSGPELQKYASAPNPFLPAPTPSFPLRHTPLSSVPSMAAPPQEPLHPAAMPTPFDGGRAPAALLVGLPLGDGTIEPEFRFDHTRKSKSAAIATMMTKIPICWRISTKYCNSPMLVQWPIGTACYSCTPNASQRQR